MRSSRFTIRQLATAVSLMTVVMASTVLAARQTQRYALCSQLAENHLKKERAVLDVVGKMKWYVKEHRRYEMPREAVEAEKMAGWFQRMASYHSDMSRKYRHATWRPWEPVPTESAHAGRGQPVDSPGANTLASLRKSPRESLSPQQR